MLELVVLIGLVAFLITSSWRKLRNNILGAAALGALAGLLGAHVGFPSRLVELLTNALLGATIGAGLGWAANPQSLQAIRDTIQTVRKWVDAHVIQRPFTAAVIAFGALFIGALLSVWPKEVADASRLAVLGPDRGEIHVWVASFWVAVFFWTVILYYRLKSDDKAVKARFEQLTAAILRAPDPAIFLNYPDLYDRAANAIASTHTPREPEEVRIKNLITGIQLVLELTATLAFEFSRAPSKKVYGANVMLIAKPRFPQELIDELRFFDKESYDPNSSLSAILYMPAPLLLADIEPANRRTLPCISLPVPPRSRDSRGHRLALPGAPWAMLEGVQSAHLDTSKIAEDCQGMAPAIIEDVQRYFSPSGDGQNVKSFVSFRIGTSHSPIGVLNIDSNQTNVLGRELEYYPTFYALVTPIVRLLTKPLIEYARLTSARGEYFGK